MKATIVIPNINGKGWLRDSIESIYAQTEQDLNSSSWTTAPPTKVWSRPAAIAPARTSPSSRTAATPASPMRSIRHCPRQERVCGALQQRRLR